MVSRESVNIILLIASLNYLDVQGADIHNSYINADNHEKFWLSLNPEFGSLEGKKFIIRKAIYGLNSAGSSFRSFIARNLYEMGFTLCVSYPDVWRRP